MIPRTPFARIGFFCLQNNMVPNKWRDFMRKNKLMPQKEVALVSRYLKIGPCTPATLYQRLILKSTFWLDVGILAITNSFSSCSLKRIFGIKVLQFSEKNCQLYSNRTLRLGFGIREVGLEQIVRHLLSRDNNDEHLEQYTSMGESSNIYKVMVRETREE